MIAPAHYHALEEDWQFFSTLTFAGKVTPHPELAFSLQKRWLDQVSRPILHASTGSILWLSREELGEQNGRFHLHLLLGGIRDASRVNSRTCLALMSEWEKVTQRRLGAAGMARIRVFQPNLRGAEYVLKGLQEITDWSARAANSYELHKFSAEDKNRTVRICRLAVMRWTVKRGNRLGQQAHSMRESANVKCGLL